MFAAELKSLCGDRKQATVQRLTGLSTGTVSTAFSGKRLPSVETTRKIAEAMDADPDAWEAKRAEAAQAGARTEPRTVPYSTAVLTAALIALLTGVASAAIAWYVTSSAMHSQAAPQAKTGDDPVETGCDRDAELVGTDTVANQYTLDLFWSGTCSANWGRITRHDGEPNGNRITVKIYGNFDNPPAPLTDERADISNLITPIMVVTNQQTVCITGTVWVGAQAFNVKRPVCR